MGKIIGIDLGTTNSVVAVMEGGDPVVIPNKEGNRTTPSVVAFTEGGERLVGQAARRQAVTNPSNTVFSIKRFMGRYHYEVSAEEKLVPYQIIGGSQELVKVQAGDKTMTPPEISAMVLTYLKQVAEEHLGSPVEKAVITVPAYFNDSQRKATKDAGTIAGLEVMRIINEPTAAALAYGLDKKKEQVVAVYDLGGGTFDISILEISGDGMFQVLATNGDTHLGGDDFDEELITYVAAEFKRENGIDLREDQMALQRLKEACEKAKCELSTQTQTNLNLPFITADATGPKHLTMTITRAKFEQLIDSLLERTRQPCLTCMKDAKLEPGKIDEVLLVGGSTRIPKVQEIVKGIFEREPNRSVNPDEVVALGAAIQGGIIEDPGSSDVLLVDVTPLSLGIETLGGVSTKLIEKNTTIPTKRSQIFSTAADNQPEVEVHVLQGEREMARDNRTLGKFNLTGIPPAPRGVPRIEVTFDIDVDGILHVNAKDQATGKEQSIRIESSSGLSEGDIDRMKREAEEHADEDRRTRELVDARNEADQRIFQIEKSLGEAGDRISDTDRQAIEDAKQELRKLCEGSDTAAIKAGIEKLMAAASKVAEALYQQPGEEGATPPPPGAGEGAAPGGPGGGGDSEDVIDADFEVNK
jgi:molecular chaperone DnaK